MRIDEFAAEYLLKDIMKNCGMLQVIKRGSGKIMAAGSEGVLLYDTISEVYMLSAENTEAVQGWLQNLPNPEVFFLTDGVFVPYLKTLYGLSHTLECEQLVYIADQPIVYKKRLEISEPLNEEMSVIRKHYHRLTESELEKVRSLHNLYVGHNELGRVVGFIGCHLEGSMGLLEILPEFRRMGYGTELESFMINKCLERDFVPFGHVVTGNSNSMKLQKKLGLKKAADKVYWLY